MKTFMTAGAALLMTTSIASAAGLDRSGQSIGMIFQDGDYAEFSFGLVQPSVDGTVGGGALSSDQIAPNYTQLGFAFKTDVNDQLSLGLIFEQPFGAAVDYTSNPAYPVYGFDAELSSSSITALANYQINDRISVHGGLRLVTMSGQINTLPATRIDYESSSDVGYVIGAAYEIPDIALRAALTYSSATTHENGITVNGTPTGGTNGEYTMPQSVNLDFQTGIAENTLLLASVRWSEWTETSINTAVGVIDFDNDGMAYSLGVARRFSDTFAGVARIGYEPSNGGAASNLSPTDGSTSLTLAGVYTMDNMTLTAGINYTVLGDATTELVGADFSDNSALGFGLKVGYNF